MTEKRKPGFYRISSEEYHATSALNKSGIVHLAKSPSHYKWNKDNPDPPTPAMKTGSALHLSVFEPDEYKKQVRVAPAVDKRTKAGKALWAGFERGAQGKIIIPAKDEDVIKNMKNAVLRNETAAALLADGIAELSGFWVHETGVMCKLRSDWITGNKIVVDLKSCLDASYKAFQKAVANLYYHWQAAFYLDGLTKLTGEEHLVFLFICVEKTAPYGVAVYQLDRESINAARRQMTPIIDQYAMCKAKGYWPGYVDEIQTLALPRWAIN